MIDPTAFPRIEASALASGDADLIVAVERVGSELRALRFRDAELDALEAAGVDNWEGHGEVEWPSSATFDYNAPRA